MSSSSHGLRRPPVALGSKAIAPDKNVLAGNTQAAVARALKKMSADSNAALFSAEAAHAAFGKIRRSSR